MDKGWVSGSTVGYKAGSTELSSSCERPFHQRRQPSQTSRWTGTAAATACPRKIRHRGATLGRPRESHPAPPDRSVSLLSGVPAQAPEVGGLWPGRSRLRLPLAAASSCSWTGQPADCTRSVLHSSLEWLSLVPFQLPTLHRLQYTTAPFVMQIGKLGEVFLLALSTEEYREVFKTY